MLAILFAGGAIAFSTITFLRLRAHRPSWTEVIPQPQAPSDASRLSLQAETGSPDALSRLRLTQRANAGRKPVIAIVIDDLGNDVPATRRAIALPKDVTLSFLPYPDATPELAREAVRAGHQVLVHVPMQPVGDEDAGPMALRIDLASTENVRRLDWDLSRVPGFSGVNNHMGSRFTADRDALLPVMRDVARRRIFFLDSRTTANSQAPTVARSLGVVSAARDVFLDDENSSANVDEELKVAEAHARQSGVSIAIGHPHPGTIDALERWFSGRDQRKIVLVDVGEAIKLKTIHAALRSQIRQ